MVCRASRDNKASLPTEQHIIVSCDSDVEAKKVVKDVVHLVQSNKRFDCWSLKGDVREATSGRFFFTMSCDSGQDALVNIINSSNGGR